jgi:hypothetical protein
LSSGLYGGKKIRPIFSCLVRWDTQIKFQD